MQRLLFLIVTLLMSISVVACSDNDSETVAETNDSEEVQVNEESAEESDGQTEESFGDGSEADAAESGSSEGIFKVSEEDQLELKIGDTGIVQTSIGTYELTVDSAEIVGTELDGEESLLDELIVINLTFKNIDDRAIDAADIMSTLEITEDMEGSGYSNGAAEFESIEEFTNEIQPGEERTAQFIGDILTSEEYYFRQSVGTVAAGASNQVVWIIADEEARN